MLMFFGGLHKEDATYYLTIKSTGMDAKLPTEDRMRETYRRIFALIYRYMYSES